jgi:hypothetical protein
MNHAADFLLLDLRSLINALGSDGGQNGPSVYDTAQVLRMAPPADAQPVVEWLLAQQQPDGGWGDPCAPLSRDTATLAALLALESYPTTPWCERSAIQAAQAFLLRQGRYWLGEVPIDIPVAAELLIPTLLEQAQACGLEVNAQPYAKLAALGQRRRQLIRANTHMVRPGTPIVHSWEAWGTDPDPALLDAAGSIGHSPAATAAWLHAARDRNGLADAREAAQRYLDSAAAATGLGIPGVVPAVWPYPRNEQAVGLFSVFLAGLMDHPVLIDAMRHQIDDLWRSVRPEGQGISDHFTCDGDITAMTFVLARAVGYAPDRAILEQYVVADGSCLTYKHELQRSFSATTHAAHALAVLGGDTEPLLDYLCRYQRNGRFESDKWHASWLYLTSHTIHALLAAHCTAPALAAGRMLLEQQQADGSWGVTAARAEETAYGALALLGLNQARMLDADGRGALERATRWLLNTYRPLAEDFMMGACWIAKGLYRPRRISRIIEVSAVLAAVLHGYGRY